jgi:thiol-disulfide isomerase/thioredoxin
MSHRPTTRPTSAARVAEARRAAQRGQNRTWWILGGVAVVVALALVAAVVVSGRSDGSSAAVAIPGGASVVPDGKVAYGDVRVTGTALAAQPQSGADPAIGQTVPALAGEQFDGTALTIPATGKPKVVMFVAHWCPHCQAEVPLISSYLDAHGLPTDVDLYAVATSTTDTRDNFPPAPWLHDAGWPVPTIADDANDTAANAYGVGGFPFFVVADAQGKVLDRQSGEMPIERFEALIAEARASVPATPAPTATPAAS